MCKIIAPKLIKTFKRLFRVVNVTGTCDWVHTFSCAIFKLKCLISLYSQREEWDVMYIYMLEGNVVSISTTFPVGLWKCCHGLVFVAIILSV